MANMRGRAATLACLHTSTMPDNDHAEAVYRNWSSQLAAGLFAAALLAAAPAHATGAGDANTVLILNNTVNNGGSSIEATKATALGYSVEIVDDAGWAAKSTADFASYKAIILGDPVCSTSTTKIAAAEANKGVWGPAISGNVILIGADVAYHSSAYSGNAGGDELTQSGIAFAAAEPGKTGAYITLSCYYNSSSAGTPVPLLDAFSAGGFTVTGISTCFNDVHIVASHAALSGLTDANLSNWNCSVHEAFDNWPANFLVLAIARNLGSSFTAPDGTVGTPYILARGEQLIALGLSLTPAQATNPVGTTHTVTATLRDATGAPVGDTLIGFKITAGPNTGAAGGCNPADCHTLADGTVTFTYTDAGGAGDDSILAFVDANANGTPDVGEAQSSALKKWSAAVDTPTPTGTPPPTLTPAPGCQTYFSTDVPKAIPDLGSVNSIINVPTGDALTSVSVLSLTGTHTFVEDLVFHLISPAGTDQVLIDRQCGSDDNFNLSLDDLGAPFVCPMTDGLAHVPRNPLATFNGQNAAGNWTLHISDEASSDTGTLQTWGLQVCFGVATPTRTPTPPPTITAAPSCQNFFASDVPQAIPDLGSITSTLNIPVSGPLTLVEVLSLAGTHTFVQDLEFHLISPAGTDLTLINRKCGNDSNFSLDLSDLGSPFVCPMTDGLPHTLPDNNMLSTFIGENSAGAWKLRIFDRAERDTGTLQNWGLKVCFGGTPPPTRTPQPTVCEDYTATDVPYPIPDLGSTASLLFVPMSGALTSVSVLSLNGTHSYVQDLEFHLTSPTGTDIIIINRQCGNDDNFNLTLDDLGAPFVCPMTDGLPHVPWRPLATFNGEEAIGAWLLTVFDRQAFDAGQLNGWGLRICVAAEAPPTPTGTPATSTPTRTGSPATPTRTRTPSPTLTQPSPHTETPTPTETPPPTDTPVPTFTPSRTRTPSLTPTGTRPPTATATMTTPPSSTATRTPTLTPTATKSLTPTQTPTQTRPPKITFTPTATGIATATPTSTNTGAPSPTATNTRTASPSITPLTPSPTATRSATPSATPTGSAGPSPTRTASATPTTTQIATASPTPTATQTRPPKITFTPTATGMATTTPTPTPSITGTRPTASLTPTASVTGTRPTATATPTGSQTASATPTGSRPATPSVTGTRPPSSATPTPSATATPGGCTACVGDCLCDGMVTVDELLTMVNIALDNARVEVCPAGDPSGEGLITVDEILLAVNNALNGCPLAPTTTPTLTQTPGTPGPTIGGASVPRRAAGTTVTLTHALQAIPAIISALSPIARGGAAVFDAGAAALKNCSITGTYDLACTQAVPSVPPRNYSLMLDNCTLATGTGSTVSLDGVLTGTSTESGFTATCSLPPLALSTLGITGLHITASGGAALTATVNVTGSLTVTPDIFSQCKIAAADLILSGTIEVQTMTLDQTLTFSNTAVRIEVEQFNDDCVPLIYTITLNRDVTLTDTEGHTFSGTFTNFVFTDDTTGSSDVVTLNGNVASSCFGTEVLFATVTPLSIPPSALCPTAGVVRATASGTGNRIIYSASGVGLDLGDDGSVDESFLDCLQAELLACPAG